MQGYIDFSFSLPVSLLLSKDYAFPIESEGIIIKTTEIVENTDQRMGRSVGIEVASDTEATFRFTEMHVLVRDENPSIPLENLTRVYEPKVIRLVNRFIDSHRYITGRHAIANISSLDSMRGFSVKRDDTGMVTFSFGAAGSVLTPFRPLLSNEQHDELATCFKEWEVTLEDQFLMDARRYVAIGHDLQALISGVTALDIVVRAYPLKKPRWFYRIFNMRDKVLGLMIQAALSDSSTKSLAIGAIRERNEVIHSGKRELGGNVDAYITAIEAAIKEIKNVYTK